MIKCTLSVLAALLFTLQVFAAEPPKCESDLVPRLDCRHFTGYKPCGRAPHCTANCAQFEGFGKRILIVHLEAAGAVLRSTSLLPAIRRKYPEAIVTWVTKAPSHQMLANNKLIDRVVQATPEGLSKLNTLEFDVAMVIDKSAEAAGIVKGLQVGETLGFIADPRNGAIVPANPEAEELWRLGLSDHLKFNVNRKSEIQLTHEALALGEYKRDDYSVDLLFSEEAVIDERRNQWSENGKKVLVGFNTGCSSVGVPYKKMTVEGQRALIEKMAHDSRFADVQVVLLGGKEDSERNMAIATGLPVINSPSNLGPRDGYASVKAVDVVFSGDSFGMHMAIAAKKRVVAWFGPTCDHEIELFGRGQALLSKAKCGPCWKRSCQKPVMCYDQVDHGEVLNALAQEIEIYKKNRAGKKRSDSGF